MAYHCSAPNCDNDVILDETPHWTLTETITHERFCSHGCAQTYLEQVIQT